MQLRLKNGFEHAESICVFSAATGEWLRDVAACTSCTWVGDPSVDRRITIDLAPGEVAGRGCSFKGYPQFPEFFGAPEDMAIFNRQRPSDGRYYAPLTGYANQTARPILSARDFACATDMVGAENIRSVPCDGRWHAVPAKAGDQSAAGFARVVAGVWELRHGGGDSAPYLCDDGSLSSQAEDDRAFDWACEALSERLESDHGDWLRASYARKQNPLPGMRKRVGGVWRFVRLGTPWERAAEVTGEIEIAGLGWVRWTPPKQ
jgi:hypothetical protein